MNPFWMEKAALGIESLVLLTQHFILRLLDPRPVTVVLQNLEDENGFSDIEMLSKTEPEETHAAPLQCWISDVPQGVTAAPR